MLPRYLKDYNMFLNGRSYQGLVTSLQPPQFTVGTEDYVAGGMSSPIRVDQGTVNALEATFTIAEPTEQVLGSIGLIDHRAVHLQFRKAIQREGESAVPHVIDMEGRFTDNSPNAAERNGNAPLELTFSAAFYREAVNGTVLHEIDPENCTRIVFGEDQMQSIRDALKI